MSKIQPVEELRQNSWNEVYKLIFDQEPTIGPMKVPLSVSTTDSIVAWHKAKLAEVLGEIEEVNFDERVQIHGAWATVGG